LLEDLDNIPLVLSNQPTFLHDEEKGHPHRRHGTQGITICTSKNKFERVILTNWQRFVFQHRVQNGKNILHLFLKGFFLPLADLGEAIEDPSERIEELRSAVWR